MSSSLLPISNRYQVCTKQVIYHNFMRGAEVEVVGLRQVQVQSEQSVCHRQSTLVARNIEHIAAAAVLARP